METRLVRDRQRPLRKLYQETPEAALVVDRARTWSTDSADPFHSRVEAMPGCGESLPVGVHAAIGGPHDAPTPGDILCAALAACQDSTIRVIANLLGIELERLEVDVRGDVDVRGTLMVDGQVPVGFQAMKAIVKLQPATNTDPARLEHLRAAAEHCCVVLQTLRAPPPIDIEFDVSPPGTRVDVHGQCSTSNG